MEKNGMLTDKSLSDFDNTKKAEYFDEAGYKVADAANKHKLSNPKTLEFEEEPLPDNYKNLGFNGEWRLKFNVPTYIWFLENL
mgnify:CR=1 FL=1